MWWFFKHFIWCIMDIIFCHWIKHFNWSTDGNIYILYILSDIYFEWYIYIEWMTSIILVCNNVIIIMYLKYLWWLHCVNKIVFSCVCRLRNTVNSNHQYSTSELKTIREKSPIFWPLESMYIGQLEKKIYIGLYDSHVSISHLNFWQHKKGSWTQCFSWIDQYKKHSRHTDISVHYLLNDTMFYPKTYHSLKLS